MVGRVDGNVGAVEDLHLLKDFFVSRRGDKGDNQRLLPRGRDLPLASPHSVDVGVRLGGEVIVNDRCDPRKRQSPRKAVRRYDDANPELLHLLVHFDPIRLGHAAV